MENKVMVMMTTTRTIEGISRAEWIAYEWIDVTEAGNQAHHFIQGRERNPTEGAQAARDWDMWYPSARELYLKNSREK